jgi:hypothetical protein
MPSANAASVFYEGQCNHSPSGYLYIVKAFVYSSTSSTGACRMLSRVAMAEQY